MLGSSKLSSLAALIFVLIGFSIFISVLTYIRLIGPIFVFDLLPFFKFTSFRDGLLALQPYIVLFVYHCLCFYFLLYLFSSLYVWSVCVSMSMWIFSIASLGILFYASLKFAQPVLLSSRYSGLYFWRFSIRRRLLCSHASCFLSKRWFNCT